MYLTARRMNSEGIALLIIYIFVAFAVVIPLTLVSISVGPGYPYFVDVNTVIDHRLNIITAVAALLTLGAVLIHRYGPLLAKPLMSEVLRVYRSHGIFDVFIRRKLLKLYLVLLLMALITYLINTGVIRIFSPGRAVLDISMITTPSNIILMIMGIVNLVLSTWLVVSISYLQLRIATRRIINRLGSVIGGAMGIAASTGAAALVGSACGLGVCTIPVSSVSPMALIVMGLFDINAVELARYSLIALPALTLVTLALLVIIHRSITRSAV